MDSALRWLEPNEFESASGASGLEHAGWQWDIGNRSLTVAAVIGPIFQKAPISVATVRKVRLLLQPSEHR